MKTPLNDINSEQGILFFDGICNLCNTAVQFVIKRDKKDKFKFASLQSETGKEFCKKYKLSFNKLTSVIYFKQGKVYLKSTAALHVLYDLGGIWQIFFIFMIIPKFIRDFVYDLIAKNRYNLFGKRKECMLPTAQNKAKFLE